MNWARSIVFGWAVWASAPSLFAAGPGQPLRGFLDQYCVECHGADSPEAGLDLTRLAWQPSDSANFDVWVKDVRTLAAVMKEIGRIKGILSVERLRT